MPATIASVVYDKRLTIEKECNRGGQGRIWQTDDPGLLVKQFEPAFIADDLKRQETLRRKATRAYRAFCAVNKGIHPELRCLPREYVTWEGNPAYIMQKADGQSLKTVIKTQTIPKDQRLPLASALARAIQLLHDAQIVHADPHPENFIVHQGTTSLIVSVLDIDGGGLLSPPGPIYPMSQPKRLYKAPELSLMQWKHLHEKALFFAPDDWALAVLLYQLLVDYEGPFCTVQKHPDPAVKDYIPFKAAAYRDPAAVWPLPWQEAMLARAALPDKMTALFYETFQHRFTLTRRPRPTASHWEAALRNPTTLPPVVNVYVLRQPPPLPVRADASRSSGHGWVAKAWRIVRLLRACVTLALVPALWAFRAAIGWHKAFRATMNPLLTGVLWPLRQLSGRCIATILGRPQRGKKSRNRYDANRKYTPTAAV